MILDNNKKNRSLRFSLLDGIFASGMVGFTQDYFAPFLLLLGATAKHIGMLAALPNLFASLVQLKSADLVDKLKSRKTIINIFIFLQALILLPMAISAFLGKATPVTFIFFVILFTSFGAITVPAWASLMSDLVEENRRGEYFGWRNKVLGFLMVAAAFIAGYTLHLLKKINAFYGFAIIFGFAFIFRVISWYFLKRMHEPSLEPKREHYFTLFNFLARIKESNFAKFVLFVSSMSFAVSLVSPFFAVLMLRDLSFSYLEYSIITVAATLTIYSVISRWGRHADKVGNLKVIKTTAPIIGIIPLLWIINRNPIFLFFTQIVAGFAWAGFNLCSSNFIYDAVSPEKRTRCISYFSVINGLALCLGALTGGIIVTQLPPLFGYKILTLCLISSFLRLAIGLFVPMRLKEVRPIENISSNQLFFSVIGIRPILGIERKTI